MRVHDWLSWTHGARIAKACTHECCKAKSMLMPLLLQAWNWRAKTSPLISTFRWVCVCIVIAVRVCTRSLVRKLCIVKLFFFFRIKKIPHGVTSNCYCNALFLFVCLLILPLDFFSDFKIFEHLFLLSSSSLADQLNIQWPINFDHSPKIGVKLSK